MEEMRREGAPRARKWPSGPVHRVVGVLALAAILHKEPCALFAVALTDVIVAESGLCPLGHDHGASAFEGEHFVAIKVAARAHALNQDGHVIGVVNLSATQEHDAQGRAGHGLPTGEGHQWSGCIVRIRLQLRLPHSLHCPLSMSAHPAHSGSLAISSPHLP